MSEQPNAQDQNKRASRMIHQPGRRRAISVTQIVLAGLIVVVLLFAINLGSRISAGQKLQNERRALEDDIATMQSERATLQSDLNYYQSDAYVEEWARRDGKMVLPGEVLVIPIPHGTAHPTPTPIPEPVEELSVIQPANRPAWHMWWEIFFDSPPPQ
jgi:cell division protein FtsB